MSISNELFYRLLHSSEPSVMAVAKHLRAEGVEITHVEDGTSDGPDNGDIVTPLGTYEVKQVSRHFTGLRDWPFRTQFIVDHRRHFIDTPAGWAPKGDCIGYYCVNPALTHYGFVPRATIEDDGWLQEVFDTVHQERRPQIMVKPTQVVWGELRG